MEINDRREKEKKEYWMHCPVCGRDFNFHELPLLQKISNLISLFLMILGVVFLALLVGGGIRL